MGSFRAELLLIRKRTSTWVLLAIAIVLTVFFGTVLPYYAYLSGADAPGGPPSGLAGSGLTDLLPHQFVSTGLGGFPFYIGMLALILGVLQVGSEYGWGTLKTTLMQRPGRVRLFTAKIVAVGAVLVLFTVGVLGTVALGSVVVALREGAAITWPPVSDILLALGAGWLILAMWALFGILLGVLFRGTSMAIGLGILYGLIIEGLITNFGNSITFLADMSQAFLRTNAYSLVAPLGVQGETGGPGSFSNGFVDPWQALIVIAAYLLIFGGISALLLQRRDVA